MEELINFKCVILALLPAGEQVSCSITSGFSGMIIYEFNHIPTGRYSSQSKDELFDILKKAPKETPIENEKKDNKSAIDRW